MKNYTLLLQKNGIEIWYQNGRYLVTDRIKRWGRFYNSYIEAIKDKSI